MREFGFRLRAALLIALFGFGATGSGMAQTTASRIDEALQNITTLVRPGRIGYATFWDGNKFVQCRRMPERELRCEAAATSMQPSLRNVLAGDRLSRLAAQGWVLDPGFGNHVRTFQADMPTGRVSEQILRTLTEVYDADAAGLEIQTKWVADMPCPPRAGPSQNLAGSVNDAPAMRLTSVRTCSYAPPADTPQTAASSTELIALYGATVTAEIQRLRINATRRVYASFNAGIGYVQCTPETPPPPRRSTAKRNRRKAGRRWQRSSRLNGWHGCTARVTPIPAARRTTGKTIPSRNSTTPPSPASS
ncbi:MAG: hypothetical protein JWR49_3921 [Tardiphaga sp.]|nr:hypothetical protein [Tardiphaga sp.]